MDKYGPLYHRNGAKFWPKPDGRADSYVIIKIFEFSISNLSVIIVNTVTIGLWVYELYVNHVCFVTGKTVDSP